jgi:hypothetical protein
MSFNRRDEHCKDSDLHKESLWEDDGNEDNVTAPDVHQRGGDVNPSQGGLVRLPLRGLKNSTCAPSLQGGRTCNVQVRPRASSRWLYGLRKTLCAQLGGLRWKPGTRIIGRGTWKTRIELLYVGGRSGTLLVVNIGRTPLPSPDSNHGETSL